jgi:hypothetical protein
MAELTFRNSARRSQESGSLGGLGDSCGHHRILETRNRRPACQHQIQREILDAALVPIAVLELPNATSDERSQALKNLETTASEARAIATSNPCPEDAIRYVAVFLEVVSGVGTTLEPEAVEVVHRKLRDTAQAKISACEANLNN